MSMFVCEYILDISYLDWMGFPIVMCLLVMVYFWLDSCHHWTGGVMHYFDWKFSCNCWALVSTFCLDLLLCSKVCFS